MKKALYISALVATLAVFIAAIGANPRYIEEIRTGGGYGESVDGGADFEDDGTILTNGGVTSDGALTGASAVIGGGYGDTGATISAAGVGQFNGALTTDGAATADSAAIGGGYGSTGASISSAGVGQFNGALTTDGAATADSAVIGGGYGDTGATIASDGDITTNGSATIDGTLLVDDGITSGNGTGSGVISIDKAGGASGVLTWSTGGTPEWDLTEDSSETLTLTSQKANEDFYIKMLDGVGLKTILFADSSENEITLGVDGGLTKTGADLQVTGNDILNSDGETTISMDAAQNVSIPSGTLTVPSAGVVSGADGTARGTLTTWDGGGGNTPGYWLTHSPNGTARYFFVDDNGNLRAHTSAPALTSDGSVVGPAASYSNLYSHNDSGDTLTITTDLQWEPFTTTTVGVEDGALSVGSAATDNITIGADGAGDYTIMLNMSGESAGVGADAFQVGVAINFQNGSILSSTNASPIVITATAAHNLSNGQKVLITDHAVNTNANGTFIITAIDADEYSLGGTTGNGAGGETGVWSVAPEDAVHAQRTFAASGSDVGSMSSSGIVTLAVSDTIGWVAQNENDTDDLDVFQSSVSIRRITP